MAVAEEEDVQDSERERLSGKRYRPLNEWHGTGIQCWLKREEAKKMPPKFGAIDADAN